MLKKSILNSLAKWKAKLKPDPYSGQDTKQRFETIFAQNDWKDTESISGPGSNSEQTKEVISTVENVIETYGISSLLDVPCGDFGWMSKVDLKGARYTGGDIVDELIETNKVRYADRKEVQFEVIDLITDTLPKADLLLVRDCLVHLHSDLIHSALNNIKRSGIRYVLMTTFTERKYNTDIHTGDWRPLNLQIEPFNLPPPLAIFNENCTENNGAYRDKCLALWDVKTL
ncbi:MAG: class I SAM-dependent methyltransferase [Bacteroidetes bacterium]|nr:MAG: class I SAM-dependent methyltransferase [Bacteroidota bacterium]